MSIETFDNFEGTTAGEAVRLAVRSLDGFAETAKEIIQRPRRRAERDIYVVANNLSGQVGGLLVPRSVSVGVNRYSASVTSANVSFLPAEKITMPEGYTFGESEDIYNLRLGIGYKRGLLTRVYLTSWVLPISDLNRRELEVLDAYDYYMAYNQFKLFRDNFFAIDETGIHRGATHRNSSRLSGARLVTQSEALKLTWFFGAINIAKSCMADSPGDVG